MNTTRLALAALAATVVDGIYGFAVYGNVLSGQFGAFPGVFRGALDVRASTITEEMKVAAGEAIAAVVPGDELSPEYVIPSVFNRDVARVVAAAVARAAEEGGVARRPRV